MSRLALENVERYLSQNESLFSKVEPYLRGQGEKDLLDIFLDIMSEGDSLSTLSYKDYADMLGVETSTVRKYVSRIHCSLRTVV